MNNPLVSVLIPVYNVEKYLDRCVGSIVSQTYQNLEIILVDDSSPDNCPAICEAWAEKDSRIKVVHHQENRGLIAARNTGIAHATGEYITFVDSDDWVTLDYVEYLLNLLTEYHADVSGIVLAAVFAHQKDRENIHETEEKIDIFNYDDIIQHIPYGLCYLCGKLYKTSLVKSTLDIPTDIFFSEDVLRNHYIYKQSKRFARSNLIKYFYFRHAGAGIQGCITEKMIENSIRAYEIVDADFDKSSSAYPLQVYNKILNDFLLLNSIIRNQCCWEYYNRLKEDIIARYDYLKKVQRTDVVKKKHLFAIRLLKTSSSAYNASILIRKKIRGY